MPFSFLKKMFTGKNVSETIESQKIKKDIVPQVESGMRPVTKKSIIEQLKNLIVVSMFNGPLDDTLEKMKRFSDKNQMSDSDIRQAVEDSIDELVIKCMDDGIFTKEEEKNLLGLMGHYELSIADLKPENHRLLAKGELVRNLLGGNIDPCFSGDGLPFKFQKKEVLIWAWGSVPISTIKTTSKIVGRSRGMSFRIMKGVYWRTGGFEGERVSTQQEHLLGYATVAVTSKHLYYTTDQATRRIKLDKILSVEPGFGHVVIYVDGPRSAPLSFGADDPWFFANVVQNAENWDA